MQLSSKEINSVYSYWDISEEDWDSFSNERREELLWGWLQSPEYKSLVIERNGDMIMGLRQDKEHLEKEVKLLKANLDKLCDEIYSYRKLWFIKLYHWFKRTR
jgi:hypothetical protein